MPVLGVGKGEGMRQDFSLFFKMKSIFHQHCISFKLAEHVVSSIWCIEWDLYYNFKDTVVAWLGR